MEINLPGGVAIRILKDKFLPKIKIESTTYYTSPSGALAGRILDPLALQIRGKLGVPVANLPTGQTAIDLDFNPNKFDIDKNGKQTGYLQPKSLGDIRRAFRNGSRDYLDFLRSLEKRKKFRNVSLIIGTTNPRMASYAVEQLGYHYASLPEDDAERARILSDRDSSITVFITKEEALKRGL